MTWSLMLPLSILLGKTRSGKSIGYCICYLQWQQGFPFIDGLLPCLHQSAPSLFLKSNFEYLRGNYRKAVKLLNSSNIAEHPGPIKTGDNSSSHNSRRAVQAHLVWAGPVQIVNVLTNASTFGRQWRCRWPQQYIRHLFYLIQVNVFDVCSGTTWAAFTLQWGSITWVYSTSRKHYRRTITPVLSWGTAATVNVSPVRRNFTPERLYKWIRLIIYIIYKTVLNLCVYTSSLVSVFLLIS